MIDLVTCNENLKNITTDTTDTFNKMSTNFEFTDALTKVTDTLAPVAEAAKVKIKTELRQINILDESILFERDTQSK